VIVCSFEAASLASRQALPWVRGSRLISRAHPPPTLHGDAKTRTPLMSARWRQSEESRHEQ
jgi:hypothetical protein